MIADRSIVFRGIESIVKWPFQNEDNFYSSALATVAFLASQRLFNVSYTFSLGFAATVFFATRVYQVCQISRDEDQQIISANEELSKAKEKKTRADLKDLQNAVDEFWRARITAVIEEAFEIDKKRKENLLNETRHLEREKNIEEMKFFLMKDFLYMSNVFGADSLNEKEEKIKTDKFSKEKEKFVKLCEYFNLDIEVFKKTWITWPGALDQEFVLHCKNRAEFFFRNIQ